MVRYIDMQDGDYLLYGVPGALHEIILVTQVYYRYLALLQVTSLLQMKFRKSNLWIQCKDSGRPSGTFVGRS